MAYKNIRFTFFLCSIVLSSFAQNEPITIDVSNDIIIPNHYIVTQTNERFNIDGLANEMSWKQAEYTESFIDIEGEKIPKFDTKVKMLWDATYLYIYAELKEPHIWGDIKNRDEVIFHNNILCRIYTIN